MTRKVQALLLAGCALVVALEAPGAIRVVSEDWRGPYAEDGEASAASIARPVLALDLALAIALVANLPG